MFLLAQEVATPPWLTGGLTTIGITFTIWYAYYTTCVQIPRMLKEFREERKEAMGVFQDSLKVVTDHCEKESTKNDTRMERIIDSLPCQRPVPPR